MTNEVPRRTPGLSLKGRALKYLAGREHSRDGLRRKLLAHADDADGDGGGAEAVERLLDDLEARGFLSNQRFAESLIHRRSASHGVRRLRDELQREGVDLPLVSDTLDQLRDTELARAQALWVRRYGQLAADDRERARQIRFLTARGFSPDVVQKVVRGRANDI